MNKKLFLLLFIFLTGCASTHIVNERKFKTYISDYSIQDGPPGELLFKLKIPATPNHGLAISHWVSKGIFMQIFSFDDEQEVITTCIPYKTREPARQALNLTYDQFKNECIKEDIFNKIQAAFKSNNDRKTHPSNYQMIESRRFGINKTGKEFYVVYLNVEPKNIADYNYCINSIVF
ncbi:MAG TPA: hypothetical protein VL490_04645 [Mucilaginibacter sp.]|jgi:hypothetical protein|nr:hypothetical protein [Mucilaginibacter sp.]